MNKRKVLKHHRKVILSMARYRAAEIVATNDQRMLTEALTRQLKARLSTARRRAAELAAIHDQRMLTAEERVARRGYLDDEAATKSELEALKKGKGKRPKVKKPPLTYDPPAPRSSEPYARVSAPSSTPRRSA